MDGHSATSCLEYGIIILYQQEIKRERSEHLISPDMVTKESFSAKRGRRVAAGFLSVLYHK